MVYVYRDKPFEKPQDEENLTKVAIMQTQMEETAPYPENSEFERTDRIEDFFDPKLVVMKNPGAEPAKFQPILIAQQRSKELARGNWNGGDELS